MHERVHERVAGGWSERRLTAGTHALNEILTIDWSQIWKDVDAEATVD